MIPEDISVELWTFVGSELAPRNCTSSWWFGNSRSQDCYHFAQDTGGVMEAEFRSAGNAFVYIVNKIRISLLTLPPCFISAGEAIDSLFLSILCPRSVM